MRHECRPLSILLRVKDEALVLLDVEDTLRESGVRGGSRSRWTERMKDIEEDGPRFSAIVTDVDLGKSP